MIFKTLLLFCAISVVTSGELDSIVKGNIGTFENTTGNTKISTETTSQGSQSCFTPEGLEGTCVLFYRCSYSYKPSQVIDLHVRDYPCGSFYEVCCSAAEIIEPTIVEKREGCGWSNSGDVSGSTPGASPGGETRFAEYPWMCAVLKVTNNSEDQIQKTYIGAGTLIHPSVILTPAHLVANHNLAPNPDLVSNPRFLVRCGEWDSVNEIEPFPHQETEVATFAIHPEFNRKMLYNDLALFFLSTPMALTTHVGVACLPSPLVTLEGGTRCSLLGWGKDSFGKEGQYLNILKKVEVTASEHSDCQSQLQKTRLTSSFKLHRSFTCAAAAHCEGDSGAPLSCPIQSANDRYMVWGALAWSYGCEGPAVMAAVSEARSWVDGEVVKRGFSSSSYTF